MEQKQDTSVSVNCGGCLITVMALIIFWALCFGVTIDGRHYDLSCSCAEGVRIDP